MRGFVSSIRVSPRPDVVRSAGHRSPRRTATTRTTRPWIKNETDGTPAGVRLRANRPGRLVASKPPCCQRPRRAIRHQDTYTTFVEQAPFLERIRFRGIGSSGRFRPFHSCGRLSDERHGTSHSASRRAGPSSPPARNRDAPQPPAPRPDHAPLLCVFALPLRLCVKLLHRPRARSHAAAHASPFPWPIQDVMITLSREMGRQSHGT
jgi:hypothetical protein